MEEIIKLYNILPKNGWGVIFSVIALAFLILFFLIKTDRLQYILPNYNKKSITFESVENQNNDRQITDEQLNVLVNNTIFQKLDNYLRVDIRNIYMQFCKDNLAEFKIKQRDFRVQRILTLCLIEQINIINSNLLIQLQRISKIDANNDNHFADKTIVRNEIMKQLTFVYTSTIARLTELHIPTPVIDKFMLWYSESNSRFIQEVGEIIQESPTYFDEMRNFLNCSRIYIGDLISNYTRDMKTFNGDVYGRLTDVAMENIDIKYSFLKYEQLI